MEKGGGSYQGVAEGGVEEIKLDNSRPKVNKNEAEEY